jgi:hypothetical protein
MFDPLTVITKNNPSMFIYNNLAPEYLCDLIPPTVSDTSNFHLRNSQNISHQANILALLQNVK